MSSSPSIRWRLFVPLGVGFVILVVAPFFGLLRDRLLELMPRAFALVLSLGFAGVLGAAGLFALRRIRDHFWWRLAGCLLALGLVGLQVVAFSRGPASVSAVERFHILEYGFLAGLFYWALRPRGGWLPVVLAAEWAAIFGVLDETVQWLVPTRVGEMRDILMNWSAAGIGLVAVVSLAPPLRANLGDSARGRPWMRLAASASLSLLVLLSAGYFDMAHLGHRVVDVQNQLVFRSWFPSHRLREIADERSRVWARRPPTALSPIALEDYYLTEATAHVERRNQALQKRNLRVAAGEERILERWYAPVLTLHGLASGRPLSLSPRQLRLLQRHERSSRSPGYESQVLQQRVFLRPARGVLWTSAVVLAFAILVLAWISRPRTRKLEP